jgi:hypothetical protein
MPSDLAEDLGCRARHGAEGVTDGARARKMRTVLAGDDSVISVDSAGGFS